MTIKTLFRTLSVTAAAIIPITLTACQEPPRSLNEGRDVTFVIERHEDGTATCRYAQMRSLNEQWDQDALQSSLRDMTVNAEGDVTHQRGPTVGDNELDFRSELKKLGIDPTNMPECAIRHSCLILWGLRGHFAPFCV